MVFLRVTKAASKTARELHAGPVSPTTASPAPPSLTTAEIDELISLKQRLTPELGRLKPDVERCEELTRKVRKQHELDPGDKTFTERGTHFDLLVGEKRKESKPLLRKIYRFFGVDEFVEMIATVTKGAVTEGLKRRAEKKKPSEKPLPVVTEFFSEEQTGWREVTVVAKAPAPQAEKKAA